MPGIYKPNRAMHQVLAATAVAPGDLYEIVDRATRTKFDPVSVRHRLLNLRDDGLVLHADPTWTISDAGRTALERLDAGELVTVGIPQPSVRVFARVAA